MTTARLSPRQPNTRDQEDRRLRENPNRGPNYPRREYEFSEEIGPRAQSVQPLEQDEAGPRVSLSGRRENPRRSYDAREGTSTEQRHRVQLAPYRRDPSRRRDEDR